MNRGPDGPPLPSTRSCSSARRLLSPLSLLFRSLLAMGPKRGRPPAAAKGKAPMQQQLEQLPLIKKPLELIGEYINVPGAFWQGRMTQSTWANVYVGLFNSFDNEYLIYEDAVNMIFYV